MPLTSLSPYRQVITMICEHLQWKIEITGLFSFG